jgi:hypothetical protein
MVRYKDVIGFVSDAFDGSDLQTPLFVVQAGFTEPFCDLSQMLKEALSSLHSTHTIRKWKGIAS